jgi:hypothetical protein
MITKLNWLLNETKPLLKDLWEWSFNYESDEDFISRMKKEHQNEFEKINMW